MRLGNWFACSITGAVHSCLFTSIERRAYVAAEIILNKRKFDFVSTRLC